MRRALLILAACSHSSGSLATLGAPGLRAIDPVKLQANTEELSADVHEGRYPGNEGGAETEQFIAAQFKALGLEPAGSDGYLQAVPLRKATRSDDRSSLVFHTRGGDVALVPGKDVVLAADPHAADVALDARLVFVGHGLAHELAGVDLAGAIAVFYGGAPRVVGGKPVDAAEHAVMADVKRRTIALREHGARAAIVIFDPARALRMPFVSWAAKVWGDSMGWLEHGEVASLPVLPVVTIDEAAFARVAPGAHAVWERLDRGERVELDLGATASLRVHAELADVTAHNVIGLLRGSDPTLAAETVVYTAHHDHLGVGPAVDGDDIYNGALDDALGVAGIIEIARAFTALPQRPKRSILFLAVTAEEEGLLGSDYFAAHPTIPLSRIVADINIDGLTPLYEQHDMVPLGAEHSTLAAHAAAAARAIGYTISPDPDPDQVYFIRSDQYSFARRGVPSVFPYAGWRDATGDTAKNKAINDRWNEDHYHRPSDVWRPEYSAAWAAREAGFDFLLGLSVANAPERPRWNPGDAFANTSSQEPTPGVTAR